MIAVMMLMASGREIGVAGQRMLYCYTLEPCQMYATAIIVPRCCKAITSIPHKVLRCRRIESTGKRGIQIAAFEYNRVDARNNHNSKQGKERRGILAFLVIFILLTVKRLPCWPPSFSFAVFFDFFAAANVAQLCGTYTFTSP